MHTLFDSTKEVAATIVDGKALPADNFSGDLVASWLAEGVPGMKGTVVNGIATDMPVLIPPNDAFFQLALLDHIESIGWYFDADTTTVDNAFCPTGEGGGQDNSCGSNRSKAEEGLKDWLGQLASMYKMNAAGKDLKYAGFQDLVLTEGEWYTPATKPKDVKWGKQKECFMNAFELATSDPDKYTYVEGFATIKGLPLAFEHAWVVTNDGKVVDNTWRTPGNAYLGIPLSNSFLLKHTLGTGVYGVFSGYSKETMELLKNGLPDNAKAMTTNEQNCGVGKGGFLPGNKCAVGGTSTTRGGETLVELRRIDKVWSMADGKPAPEHVQKLGIPPAWKNVYANLDPNGTVLAKGEDSKGRIQTRYSDNHEAKAAAAKFGRVTELRSKRQEIFDELTADAKNKDLRDNAHCLEVIMRTGMRPGGGKDTKAEHKSFGATTLEGRHVIDNGNGTVTLRLVTGKNKGREVDFPITDSGTAKMLLRRAVTAGADGRLFSTTAEGLRGYSKTKDGEGFKTKDHRTALGTETAANAVKRMGNKKEFKSIKEYKEAVKEVATEVANVLGNTPIIALKSYVDPTVFSAWTYPR